MATEIEERQIDVGDLQVGMYVCRLDRPWEDTPFPLQGIEILDDDDIEALRELCGHVYIDKLRSVAVEIGHRPPLTRAPARAVTGTGKTAVTRIGGNIRYVDKCAPEEEIPRAREALANATELVDRIYQDIASGEKISAEMVEQSVRPLVASVLRNVDAYLFVESLRHHDSYSYSHSIGCSALAAAFGRHLGFAESTIVNLAAGGLLMDVGKTRLPEALLQRPGPLTPAEIKLVRAHVDHGVEIVTTSEIKNDDVLGVVRTHHERFDGSGYPHGLAGNAIPVAGRMLGIIDTFDAMTTVRPYRAATSRHHTLREIYAARNRLFQAEMVEQFQVCLGVYPTGSLVELGTGELAVVMTQNQVRRLRPKVLVVTDREKQPLSEFRVADLMSQQDKKGLLDIVRSLAQGEYVIDGAEQFLADLFL